MIRTPEGSLPRRLWASPTVATWASLGARSLELGLVLPLVLSQLAPAEIAAWYLFASALALQLMLENGFNTTFVRIIAYGAGGSRRSGALHGRIEPTRQQPGPIPAATAVASTAAAWVALREIYRRLAVAVLLLTASLGTLAMWRPLGQLATPEEGWWAWAVLVLTTPLVVAGNRFTVFLLGIDRVALQRRFEAASLLVLIGLEAGVLAAGGGLFELVVTRQVWALANVGLNRWLCARSGKMPVDGGGDDPDQRQVRGVLEAVMPSAWRSSLGVGMATGLVEASGIFYAQIGDSAQVATYLVALKLMQGVLHFSAAPFYSRLPRLAQLYARGDRVRLVAAARRGMTVALWTFVLVFGALGAAGPIALELVGSQVPFAPAGLWTLMGWAFFVERYGAMHMQLFSTTNRILWHIANGVSGAIYLVVAFLCFRALGVYAFPLASLAGQLGFYTWFSARLSYRTFELRFWHYERTVLLPALAAMALLALAFLV
ncbi:MAG: hypothetical protein MI919_18815 [Holophagales bacterium]|nr:hypothetical protein [Holophagales bacterium]